MGAKTNLLVLGKTGAGKSSLINYLYGKDVAKSGAGKPQTEHGIHPIEPFVYNGLKICPYDTWGLEEGARALDWEHLLKKEMEENGEKEIRDWFHSLLYCLDATRTRLDEYEAERIIRPFFGMGCRLIFVLTKCDKAGKEKISALRGEVQRCFGEVPVLEIGSVSEKLRNGRVTQTFGREQLLRLMCINLRENLISRLIYATRKFGEEQISTAYSEVLDFYDEEVGSLGIFTHYGEDLKNRLSSKIENGFSAVLEQVKQKLEGRLETVNDITREVLQSYAEVRCNLDEGGLQGLVGKAGFVTWGNTWTENILSAFKSFTNPAQIVNRKNEYQKKLLSELINVKNRVRKTLDREFDEISAQGEAGTRRIREALQQVESEAGAAD